MFILDALQRSFETSIEILKNFTWVKVKSKKKKKKKKKKKMSTFTNMCHQGYKYSILEKTKLQRSSNEAKALGIVFSTNKKQNLKVNLDSKIKQFETCLKQWQHRKLTLMGKVSYQNFCSPKTNICTFFISKSLKSYNPEHIQTFRANP